jgi:hypothetical protein
MAEPYLGRGGIFKPRKTSIWHLSLAKNIKPIVFSIFVMQDNV